MKKILILTSSGGGGTLSASTAIENYLKNDYQITTLHLFNDLLRPLDFFNKITFGRYSCEDMYNILIPKKRYRTLTIIYHFGRWYIHCMKKRIAALLRTYLITHKPDLVISVIPIVNTIVLSVTEELDIPFVLIPTDLDLHMYILNIKKPTHTKFHIGLPFADTLLQKPLLDAHIPANITSVIGAALRHAFFIKKDIPLLKKEFGIPENRPVIMILMGAQGTHGIENYLHQLNKIKKPLHIMICTGKNNSAIAQPVLSDHITLSVFPFTSRIADLMALSDIIITKSGTLSVCESIYMNIPIILDATSTVLPWERMNHDFIKHHKLGTSITSYSQIAPLIATLLDDPEQLLLYKNNLKALHKECIETELKNCVKKMLT